MGRPRKVKVNEEIPQNVGVAKVETIMDVEVVTTKKAEQKESEFVPARDGVRGEFKRADPIPKVVYPSTFECYEGHITRGASSYVSVPCCICTMESNLKSIQKEFIQ